MCLRLWPLVAVVTVLVGSHVSGAEWVVTQLTDNGYQDYEPQVSGSRVVWSGYDGNDHEIFLYDGTTVTQLTDNDYYDWHPQVSGSSVVWEAGVDGDPYTCQIFLYDGTTVTRLTDNSGHHNGDPRISGSSVVWFGGASSNEREIFLYDGTTVTQLTDNAHWDQNPDVSGSNVVWRGDNEIFLYDGATVTQLTDNGYFDAGCHVSGSNVVWFGGTYPDYEVFLYDGMTTRQLSDNGYEDSYPQVSGSSVVWEGGGEIWLYDGSTTTQLTSSGGHVDAYPQVSGSNVVWEGEGGTEIFLYDGSTTTRLTDNDYNDWMPQVSGSTVAWYGFPSGEYGGYAAEIFVATYAVPVALSLTEINGCWGDVAMFPKPLDSNSPRFPLAMPVTLTAEPIEGRQFKHWIVYDPNHCGDANYAVYDSNNPITILMDTDREVTAVFECGSNMSSFLPLAFAMLGLFVWVRRKA